MSQEVVTVYRLEHGVTGVGPYRFKGNPYIETFTSNMDFSYEPGDVKHNRPEYDGLGRYMDQNEVCGFASLDDLEDWFEGFLPNLLDMGFKIMLYVVEKRYVSYAKHQVVFNPTGSLKEEYSEKVSV